jgi:hypothetical protein
MLLAEPLARALGQDTAGQKVPKAAGAATAFVAIAAALLVAGVRLAWPVTRVDSPSAPITALAHVPPALRREPVFNNYGMGGYLISQGVRPFIDGRTDMYGDAFANAFWRVEAPDLTAFDATLARWKVRWTLLTPSDPLTQVLDRKPGWRRLYADRYAVVHVRDAAAP